MQELWDSTAFYRCGEQPKQVTECHNVVSERVAGLGRQYHHATPGQQLDMTDVPDGDYYYLVSKSNFAGIFTESDAGNNTAWTRFRLYSDSNGNRKVEITGHSPCVMGSGMCGENATNR
ncbi:MAG: hypothetical protein ACRDNA_06055 [Gaiellaceae bacterium]